VKREEVERLIEANPGVDGDQVRRVMETRRRIKDRRRAGYLADGYKIEPQFSKVPAKSVQSERRCGPPHGAAASAD